MGNTHVYEEYFGLREHPFSITPDPRFVYLSDIHRAALEHLESGATGGVNGFVLLTGDVGTGKTTICRTFLEKLPPRTEVALILNPVLTLNEFLQTICDELDLVIEGSRESNKNLIDQLNRFLLQVYAVGQKTILIVDEAQNLSQELLEQIRLLTNLETATDKLLQIFLIGQPELRAMLDRPEMAQVSQRITSRYHLGPLGLDDTESYIMRRLDVAGAPAELDFTSSGLRRIYAFSKGVPRVINVLCDKALLSAYENGTERIDAKVVKEAEGRMVGNLPAVDRSPSNGAWLAKAASITLVVLLLALVGAYWTDTGGLRFWVNEQFGLAGDEPVVATQRPADPVAATPPVPKSADDVTPSATEREAVVVEAVPATGPADRPPAADGEPVTSPALPAEQPSSLTQPEVAASLEPTTPAANAMASAAETETLNPAPVVEDAERPTPASDAAVVDAIGDASAPVAAIAEAPAAAPTPPPPSGIAPAEVPPTKTPPAAQRQPAVVAATPEQSLADFTRSYAERKLLSMWGITGSETVGLDFCQTAARQGLECLNESSQLRGLYLYDRPAIIFLTIDNVSSYAVVLKASASSVVLDVLDQEHVIPASSLNEVWDGRFLLLWQKPAGVGSLLREGMTGPAVLWVRRAIDRVEGTATSGNVYDATLAARVKRFQRQAGLAPDGIVGPRTFILLQNKLAGSG